MGVFPYDKLGTGKGVAYLNNMLEAQSFDSVLALTQVMLRWRVFGSSRQACHCFPLLKTGCGHSVLAYH